jgi:hypothetical protein
VSAETISLTDGLRSTETESYSVRITSSAGSGLIASIGLPVAINSKSLELRPDCRDRLWLTHETRTDAERSSSTASLCGR